MNPRKIAITRKPAATIEFCELTHIERSPIDFDNALLQHQAYEDTLRSLGLEVISLPAIEGFPDSCFVEDTAVVFEEFAVLMRPAAASRSAEVAFIEPALRELLPIKTLPAQGTVDGGDILKIGDKVFVGQSTRTNTEGFEAIKNTLDPYGYSAIPVEVSGSLHLKTAVTFLGHDTVLLNPDWVNPLDFSDFEQISINPEEPFAGCTINADGKIVNSASFPFTQRRIEDSGFELVPVDIGEFEKAEAGVSCLSLLI